MIKGARSNSAPSVHRDELQITDEQLLDRYMEIKKIPCVIQSPLREDDDTPSFSIYRYGGRVWWKDFGTGEAGTVIDLLAKLWNCKYQEALLKIKLDIGEKIPKFNLIRRYRGKIHITSNSSIRVRIRPWKDWDRDYWRSYGITEYFAQKCNVYPISHAFFHKDNGEEIAIPMDKYAYAYFEWKDGEQTVKLYQPFSTRLKWLSKHDQSVWDLWKQAMKWASTKSDKECIITSSRKDAMCLWENLNVPAMSLQGEGYLPKPQVMKQVLDTFKTVYLWYDNDYKHEHDNPGQDNAKKLIKLYPELHNICIPNEYQSKDPSDLVKNWGVDILKEIWNNQKKSNNEK